MIIGFTGTRGMLTLKQRVVLKEILVSYPHDEIIEFHHGGCTGADYFAHCFVYERKILFPNTIIVVHPGNTLKYWGEDWSLKRPNARLKILKPKPNLQRNKDIISACDYWYACPSTPEPIQRSGTWSTIRYAMKNGVPGTIITPVGSTRKVN